MTTTALTDKERKVIDYIIRGLSNKQIATEMCTTEQVIKNLNRFLYKKLGVTSRLELTVKMLKKPEAQVQ